MVEPRVRDFAFDFLALHFDIQSNWSKWQIRWSLLRIRAAQYRSIVCAPESLVYRSHVLAFRPVQPSKRWHFSLHLFAVAGLSCAYALRSAEHQFLLFLPPFADDAIKGYMGFCLANAARHSIRHKSRRARDILFNSISFRLESKNEIPRKTPSSTNPISDETDWAEHESPLNGNSPWPARIKDGRKM